MTANGKVEFAWGDGDHVFNIAKLGQVLELEDKCGCGVSEVFDRLRNGRWKFNDVRETVRLGLIGGGKSPVDALILVKRYVDERPWAENVGVALAIIMAAIIGVPGDEVGKIIAEGTKTEPVATDSSAPQSMEPELSSDGHQEKQMKPLSGSLPLPSMDTSKPMVEEEKTSLNL